MLRRLDRAAHLVAPQHVRRQVGALEEHTQVLVAPQLGVLCDLVDRHLERAAAELDELRGEAPDLDLFRHRRHKHAGVVAHQGGVQPAKVAVPPEHRDLPCTHPGRIGRHPQRVHDVRVHRVAHPVRLADPDGEARRRRRRAGGRPGLHRRRLAVRVLGRGLRRGRGRRPGERRRLGGALRRALAARGLRADRGGGRMHRLLTVRLLRVRLLVLRAAGGRALGSVRSVGTAGAARGSGRAACGASRCVCCAARRAVWPTGTLPTFLVRHTLLQVLGPPRLKADAVQVQAERLALGQVQLAVLGALRRRLRVDLVLGVEVCHAGHLAAGNLVVQAREELAHVVLGHGLLGGEVHRGRHRLPLRLQRAQLEQSTCDVGHVRRVPHRMCIHHLLPRARVRRWLDGAEQHVHRRLAVVERLAIQHGHTDVGREALARRVQHGALSRSLALAVLVERARLVAHVERRALPVKHIVRRDVDQVRRLRQRAARTRKHARHLDVELLHRAGVAVHHVRAALRRGVDERLGLHIGDERLDGLRVRQVHARDAALGARERHATHIVPLLLRFAHDRAPKKARRARDQDPHGPSRRGGKRGRRHSAA